jgi:hypothetical protein
LQFSLQTASPETFGYTLVGLFDCMRNDAVKFATKDQIEDHYLFTVQTYDRNAVTCSISTKTAQQIRSWEGVTMKREL